MLVVAALGAHLVGNLLTGRLKARYVNKQWPEHDGPPVPLLNKFLHFQHVFSMFALGFTGLYIRFPFFDGDRSAMRGIHYVFMIVVTVNFVWRLWCAFFSKRRDYKEFAITKQDVFTAPKCALYYVFIRSSKPHFCKYNVMQKATYILFVPLMTLQALTGFALVVTPFIFGYSPRDLLLGWWLGALVGSTDLAGWYARSLHYMITWLFIILTTVHAYLCVTEDFPAVRDFFGILKRPRLSRRVSQWSRGTPGDGRHEEQPHPSPALTHAQTLRPDSRQKVGTLTPMQSAQVSGPSAGDTE